MKVAVLLATAAVASAALGQDSGLMLGLEDRVEGATTVFVQRKGVATFAREAGSGYWLWQDKGFLRVMLEGEEREGARVVHVTSPDGAKRRIEGEEGRPDTWFSVSYVSTFGIGLLQSMSSKAVTVVDQGAFVRTNEPTRYPSTFRNFAWADLNAVIEVSQLFPEKTAADFQSMAKTVGVTDATFEDEASPTNWTLRRDEGRWHLFGALMPNEGFSQATRREFSVAVVTDPKLGASKYDGPKWVRIRTEYPEAIDATTSPDGKLTVVVTPDSVFVHESSGTTLGKRLQQVRVPASRVVMTQWLDGDSAAKAAAALAKS